MDENSIFKGPCPRFKPSYFLGRIMRFSNASPCCCVAALIYIERFQKRCPSVSFTTTTFHRLLLVASMIADKYLEDETFKHNNIW